MEKGRGDGPFLEGSSLLLLCCLMAVVGASASIPTSGLGAWALAFAGHVYSWTVVLTAFSGVWLPAWCHVFRPWEVVGSMPEYGGFCFVLFFLLFFFSPFLTWSFRHCIWIQDGLLLLAVVCISCFWVCIFPLLCWTQDAHQKETDNLTDTDFCALSLSYFSDGRDLFLVFCPVVNF